jgi:uncharacterized membrane protein YphA (DoxX/SURF4 family)
MTSLYVSLDKARPYILSVLRIVVALLFTQHGLQKYFGFPSAGTWPCFTALSFSISSSLVAGLGASIAPY